MKNYRLLLICIIALLTLSAGVSAQTTTLSSTFTYQGYLTGASGAVSGTCDFQFSLYDALTSGTQIGTTLTKTNLNVSNGAFSVQLDFGTTAFDGTDRYLQIAVRCPAGDGGYTPLTPRQTITAAPYALGMYGLEVEYNATSPNIIGGYSGNSVSSGRYGATIGGGGGDGGENQVTANQATVSGGADNTAAGGYATVGGGSGNLSDEIYDTVSGGNNNIASGGASTVSGGIENDASGAYSTVAGGYYNTAAGTFSFAAGHTANANHYGSFIWSDGTDLPNGFYTTAANQFAVHAAGGIRLVTGSDAQGLDSVACFMYVGQGSWSCTSDRNAKANIEPIDSRAILNEVVQMPITSWVYKGTTTRHIGPMAQDFFAAFGVGENDKTITNVDADGVALAAIQGLNQQLEEKERQIADLQQEVNNLQAQNQAFEARLAALEQAVGTGTMNEASLAFPMLVFGGLMLVGVWLRRAR